MRDLAILAPPIRQPETGTPSSPVAPPIHQGGWEAVIASEPDPDGVMVTIPGFSPNHLYGPCPWTPHPYVADPITDETVITDESIITDEGIVRRTAPRPGDRALVTFSDQKLPWIGSNWAPTATSAVRVSLITDETVIHDDDLITDGGIAVGP